MGNSENKSTSVSKVEYTCPMKCEGDKVYDQPGICPVCQMKLVPVGDMGMKKPDVKLKPGTIYTCPMHPEIKSDKPGSCPKCGMALVPEKGGEIGEEENSYKKMAKKFWIAVAFTVPVFIIAMSDLIPSLHLESIVSKKVLNWVSF